MNHHIDERIGDLADTVMFEIDAAYIGDRDDKRSDRADLVAAISDAIIKWMGKEA